MHPLDSLFAPRAVAVLGVRGTDGEREAALTAALASFPGPLLKIDADRPDPERDVHATLANAVEAHGTVPDLVVSCATGPSTADALREAATAGARAALLHSGRPAATDAQHAAERRALADAVRETGIRVLGPGASGFVVPSLRLAAGPAPGITAVEAGPVALVTGDDGTHYALAFALAEAGVGLRLGVGVGDGVDVTHADVLRHLAEDDGVRAVALHVESVASGRRLADAVRRLVGRTPVVALVVRSGGVGGPASWRVARAALRQAGAVLVDDERDLVDAVTALGRTRLPPRPRPGVGLVTTHAGPGLLFTENLRAQDVHLPPLVKCTAGLLDGLLPAPTGQRNPVDAGHPLPALPDVVERVSEDPSIDVTVVHTLLGPTATDLPAALGETRPATPLIAVLGGPPKELRRAREVLDRAGVPCAPSAAAGTTMVRALVDDAAARARLAAADITPPTFPPLPFSGAVDEHTAKRLLAQLGVPVPEGRVCADPAEAHRAFDELGGPVVLKSLDAGYPHRIEVRLRTHEELDIVLAGILPGLTLLIERAVPDGPELAVAVRRDPAFGPVVSLGAGGPAAAALGDVSLRLAPLSVIDTHTMLDELVTLDLILGAHDVAGIDRSHLCGVLLALACLGADERVAECEIGSLRILPDGDVVALDAVLLMTD
ncbi:acetate--CoA ligase family protein [Streptomyces sp. NPDC004539]|uniref:acetate--CoA ligase family protein n=1 Tax=Streptomyces sp. NPDC004539 TaxID=3154280 RepID=UPI0033A1C860